MKKLPEVVVDNYTSGESEVDNTRGEFWQLEYHERNEHLKELWRLCYLKSMGAGYILKIFYKLHNKVITYGTTKNINVQVQQSKRQIVDAHPLILLPEYAFKKYWNLLMIILLIYVATYVPYSICFNQPSDELTTGEIIDIIVDVLFFIDIIVNFLSAYDDPKSGQQIVDLKLIAMKYIKGWFLLDLLAVLPVQLFEAIMNGGQSFKLARLARIPRLYRLIRILRMVKMFRIFRKQSIFKDILNSMDMHSGLIRMLKVIIFTGFLVHIMSCFWFMAATLEENLYDTWVGHRGIVDRTTYYQYLNSLYWVFQTLTTVGQGDFVIGTTTEYIFCLCWMTVGVNFYSYTIGNVSSIIANMDTRSALLNSRLASLSEYSVRYKLPLQIQKKIKHYFTNHSKNHVTDQDWEELLMELPQALRTDVVQQTHGQIIQNIRFFKDKSQDFLMHVIPKLKRMNMFDNDILFSQGDKAEEIFFVLNGTVLLMMDLTEIVDMSLFISEEQSFNIPLAIYTASSYFGDNDVLLSRNANRSSTAICQTDCQLFSLNIAILNDCLSKHTHVKKTMHKIAVQKEKYYQVLKDELQLKYKKKAAQEQLINQKKNEEWTFYMSLKRQMVKKTQVKKHSRKIFNSEQELKNKSELKAREKEARRQRIENKKMANQLGVNKKNKVNIHLQQYTNDLKKLIENLNDNHLVEPNLTKMKTFEEKKEQWEEATSGQQQNQELTEQLVQDAAQYAFDKKEIKERIKIKLMNESQTYY